MTILHPVDFKIYRRPKTSGWLSTEERRTSVDGGECRDVDKNDGLGEAKQAQELVCLLAVAIPSSPERSNRDRASERGGADCHEDEPSDGHLKSPTRECRCAEKPWDGRGPAVVRRRATYQSSYAFEDSCASNGEDEYLEDRVGRRLSCQLIEGEDIAEHEENKCA